MILAHATLGALLGLLLGLIAFVTSRLWLLVAPQTGRRPAFWMATVGAAAAALFGVIGQTAFYSSFHTVADGLVVTAFMVLTLIVPAWLFLLLVRKAAGFVRRRLKRPHPGVPARPWAGWAGIGAVSACIALVVVGDQWGEYEREATRLRREIDWTKSDVRNLQVTEQKASEFRQEATMREAKLQMAERILPAELGVREFISAYTGVCRDYGFGISEWKVSESWSEALQRAEISVSVNGDGSRLPALASKTLSMARLTDWKEVDVSGPRFNILLTIYALREEPPRSSDPCATQDKDHLVWLLPYRGRLSRLQDDKASLCRERHRYDVTRAAVEKFLAQGARIKALVAAIERQRPCLATSTCASAASGQEEQAQVAKVSEITRPSP